MICRRKERDLGTEGGCMMIDKGWADDDDSLGGESCKDGGLWLQC